jgi:hypothetical protein
MTLQQLKSEMRALLAGNKFDHFFQLWEREVDVEADLGHVILLKRADLARLRREEMGGTISHDDAERRRNQVVNALLETVSDLAEEDRLKGGPAAGPGLAGNNLTDLLRRKIEALERDLILVAGTDAGREFKLREDIAAAKAQLNEMLSR